LVTNVYFINSVTKYSDWSVIRLLQTLKKLCLFFTCTDFVQNIRKLVLWLIPLIILLPNNNNIALLLLWNWLLVIWTKTLIRYTETHKSDMISGHDRNALRKVIGCNTVGYSWGSRVYGKLEAVDVFLFFSRKTNFTVIP